MRKTRRGDREVEIKVPSMRRWRRRTPVLIDDIISTGHTMAKAVRALAAQGFSAPICIGTHGLFIEDAERRLREAGAARIITTNAIDHETNAIELSGLLASAVREMIGRSTA